MKLFTNGKVFTQFEFDKEADFEREVVANARQFFGSGSIYIDAKKKIDAKSLGGSIPDGFLFDLSDRDNPQFYIVEAELAKHSFFNHIFPQITKFFGFFKNPKSQTELVEKIFSIVNNDVVLRGQFKKFLGENEIYKFLKDTIDDSQNILLIIDGEKKEIPDIMDTYTEWGEMIKPAIIRKFKSGEEVIYTMHPDFEAIEFAEFVDNSTEEEVEVEKEELEYTEDVHLQKVSDNVKEIYNTIKIQLQEFQPGLIFNPQKYYISIKSKRNIAFLIFRRKKIKLVVKQSEEDTRKEINNHAVKTLAASVQRFWNGPSCAIILESTDNLEEVTTLLKKLILNQMNS